MKGRNSFTKTEILELERLIILRNKTASSGQKAIRDKMRKLGFYGKDDWGITDLQISDLNSLIKSSRIKIKDENYVLQNTSESKKIQIKVNKVSSKIKSKDEDYVLDLCDKALGSISSRQHRFDFLLGDVNKNGKASKLPVDSFYKDLNLVIEYRERQHTENVIFFDKPNRITVSGVHRGEQRKIYDERRRLILPKYHIKLVEISYSNFNHDNQKRIIRSPEFDLEIIKKILVNFINKNNSH